MATKPNPLTPQYVWDEASGRYKSATTKRYTKFSAVRDALDKTADASAANIRALADQLRAGQLSVGEWEGAMLREIKIMHTASAAAARGGWAQMSQADWGATGQLVRSQYGYLHNFAQEVASGKQPLNGRLNVRADLYTQAARGTFEDMRRRYEKNNNLMEEERRVLGAKESCPDCIEYAGRGWSPIGSLPRIGQSVCRTNCACRFEYRRQSPDGSYQISGG